MKGFLDMNNNLKCTATACMHNKDTNCCLDVINVVKMAPEDFIDTICASYEKGSFEMKTQKKASKAEVDIQCNARNCKYNLDNLCSKIDVTIALNFDNAECINFKTI